MPSGTKVSTSVQLQLDMNSEFVIKIQAKYGQRADLDGENKGATDVVIA